MINLIINGVLKRVDVDPDTPLLYVLRNYLGMNAAKFGCGLGQCGACTVIVDSAPVFSCLTPVSVLEGRAIKTVEGARYNLKSEPAATCVLGRTGRAMRLLHGWHDHAGASSS
jgi:aerobic-type carbon monoxide dehydrogenase small subunit (CoxS/CutS family)